MFVRKVVIIREQPLLTDTELIKALAAHIDGVPFFDAFIQLIDGFKEQAEQAAIASVGNHGVCASEVGAVQVLIELKGKAIELQRLGRLD